MLRKIVNGKKSKILRDKKPINLLDYRLIGKKTNIDAMKYIKEIRNEW